MGRPLAFTTSCTSQLYRSTGSTGSIQEIRVRIFRAVLLAALSSLSLLSFLKHPKVRLLKLIRTEFNSTTVPMFHHGTASSHALRTDWYRLVELRAVLHRRQSKAHGKPCSAFSALSRVSLRRFRRFRALSALKVSTCFNCQFMAFIPLSRFVYDVYEIVKILSKLKVQNPRIICIYDISLVNFSRKLCGSLEKFEGAVRWSAHGGCFRGTNLRL